MDTMKNGYKCTAKWALEAAIGEVAQAKQSLFWAEESAEKRGVEKSKDMVVQANTDRVNIAQEREARERNRFAGHDCSRDSVCAILQKDENGS